MWQHSISICWINVWRNPDINNIYHLPLHSLSMLSFLFHGWYKSHVMGTDSTSGLSPYIRTISISVVYFLTQWKQCLFSAHVNRPVWELDSLLLPLQVSNSTSALPEPSRVVNLSMSIFSPLGKHTQVSPFFLQI